MTTTLLLAVIFVVLLVIYVVVRVCTRNNIINSLPKHNSSRSGSSFLDTLLLCIFIDE